MEAVSRIAPKDGYLQGGSRISDKYNVILIFDEVVTVSVFIEAAIRVFVVSFRILPAFRRRWVMDMPIAALVGRAKLMSKCPEIFFLTNICRRNLESRPPQKP